MKHQLKLTPEQQQQVARALPHALAVAHKHTRFYGAALDFEGAVALWLCEQIAKFDPKKSDLKAWASWQARFACWQLMSLEVPEKSRNKYFRKARFLSLDATFDPDGVPLSAHPHGTSGTTGRPGGRQAIAPRPRYSHSGGRLEVDRRGGSPQDHRAVTGRFGVPNPQVANHRHQVPSTAQAA